MEGTARKFEKKAIDYVYAAPALLMIASVLCSVAPLYVCFELNIFFELSVAIFAVSIIYHIYILCLWSKYVNYAPLAYAIVQPSLHMGLMIIAMALAIIDPCIAKPSIKKAQNLQSFNPEEFGLSSFSETKAFLMIEEITIQNSKQ